MLFLVPCVQVKFHECFWLRQHLRSVDVSDRIIEFFCRCFRSVTKVDYMFVFHVAKLLVCIRSGERRCLATPKFGGDLDTGPR